ncbi:ER degradation-enhancing alpha-mannosidase-like protein 2 isoform X1 [Drosophila miranda]|uniref:ER degradation-enhancing alpha-mannosidase-like protein 2 isoform X1 n=1 Tax=Drosophila miranda TaxID=7229 RepID=UPI0007E6AE5B|nr:ER degradation-enhancing alpha-mannosidase-like protein 2 isoform X1 [Drosophila miranda]XP_017137335.1 ER degradation-enhancing alpha-mannosidase-like protein 2 isoform X1 [Drosophila miranda]
MQKVGNNLYVICHLWVFLGLLAQGISQKHYTRARMLELREDVRRMFQHAYDGYLTHASNYDELRPLTCDGHDTWGSYSLTLIDALDTLATMGNFTEFQRVFTLLTKKMNFDRDINVSVFETNIRIVGGLLSAHLLSRRAGVAPEPGWPCQGPLLRMAEDVARRLLPAFDTNTGMPYGTVNLRYGVPKGETPVTCTAGVGTFLVEFGTLSRLTGNKIYEEVALQAVYALWEHRSPIGLFGNHIDVQSGRWTALDSGIGAGVDSLFEYLVKAAILLNRPELLELFHEARAAIDKYMRKEDWYVWVGMNKGHVTLPVFQSLEAFWPGILSIIGDTEPAMRTIVRYISVWKKYGFLPEFYNIAAGEASPDREVYPLRPELIESAMYLYRSTKNEYLLELGERVLESLEFSAKTKCGYATIRNVLTHEKENRMESFFLAETSKYLYLLFDSDNFLHSDGAQGELVETEENACVVQAGAYIFNTEAHPMDMSALHCCHDHNEDIFGSLDLQGLSANAIFKRSREQQMVEQEHWVPQCQSQDFPNYDEEPIPDRDRDRDRDQEKGKHSTTMAVDIEVFDEFEQPVGDVLVSNFERIREERELNPSLLQIKVLRNQLTVRDLDEFFARRRENFASATDALNYVLAFMGKFTMDVAFIRGLQLFDSNISNFIGAGAQKEYEERMRSLWELYDLEQQYAANVLLVQHLQLLSFQTDGEVMRTHLAEVLDGLDRQQDPLHTQLEIAALADSFSHANSTPQVGDIDQAILKACIGYEIALMNTTAIQAFVHRIYLMGTKKAAPSFSPLLDPVELGTLKVVQLKPPEQRELFKYTRRLVTFRKRMSETVDRLQTLMQKLTPTKEKAVAVATATAQPAVVPVEAPPAPNTNTEVREKAVQPELKQQKESKEQEVDSEEGSVWSQFVQTILRKTTVQRVKFDEALLQEKTRKALEKHSHDESPRELFTCQRPEFIEQFAYREFYPVT